MMVTDYDLILRWWYDSRHHHIDHCKQGYRKALQLTQTIYALKENLLLMTSPLAVRPIYLGGLTVSSIFLHLYRINARLEPRVHILNTTFFHMFRTPQILHSPIHQNRRHSHNAKGPVIFLNFVQFYSKSYFNDPLLCCVCANFPNLFSNAYLLKIANFYIH